MGQAQRRITEGLQTISWAKKRLSKDENFLENLESPLFTGGFQVENLMQRVQNLLFRGPTHMIDLGNQFKAVFACKKLSKLAIKVLKKMTS